MQNHTNSLSREPLVKAGKCVPLYVGDRKRQYFSLKPSHSMLLKGKSGMHNEIWCTGNKGKLYLVVEEEVLSCSCKLFPRPSPSSGAWALFQGPQSNSCYWSLRLAVVSIWEPATQLFRRRPGLPRLQSQRVFKDSKDVARRTDRRCTGVETGGWETRESIPSTSPAPGDGGLFPQSVVDTSGSGRSVLTQRLF